MLLRRYKTPRIRQVKNYYEELSEIRSDHDRVSEGYIKLSDADKIDIIDIGKTLCTVLTNKTGPDGKSCPKTATGEIDVKGDYCSTTKSAGGCQDSFWLAATLAASATELQANPTDPFCTGTPTN